MDLVGDAASVGKTWVLLKSVVVHINVPRMMEHCGVVSVFCEVAKISLLLGT